jgi:hypothetical protein
MYGPFPSGTKEEIISKVGREFNESFKVDSIYVWSDKGLPHEWKLIKKIPLGKNRMFKEIEDVSRRFVKC